jgi:hypothetical protein
MWRVSEGNQNVRQVPGDWYVHDAVRWAPGQVMLFVGPTGYPDLTASASASMAGTAASSSSAVSAGSRSSHSEST